MLYRRKGQLQILIFNLVTLVFFSADFISRKNYEFIIYVGVIFVFIGLIIISNRKVYYPNAVLWALSIWALLHMAGGSLYIGKAKLYELMILRLSQSHPVLRYDQLVHIFGFGTATVTLFYVLKPLLRTDLTRWTALSIVVVLTGLGVGALNEIVEFITSCIVPKSGVGGYVNTSLDLVSNLLGALLALVVIRITHKNSPASKNEAPTANLPPD